MAELKIKKYRCIYLSRNMYKDTSTLHEDGLQMMLYYTLIQDHNMLVQKHLSLSQGMASVKFLHPDNNNREDSTKSISKPGLSPEEDLEVVSLK